MHRRLITAWLGLVLCQLLLLPGMVRAENISLSKGADWEYRWGDSPFTDAGVPVWTQESNPDAWTAIDFPSNPEGRGDHTNVWYRVTLPEGQWRDPVLYIFSVDLIVQIYLDGEKIYEYGAFDANGQGRFEGWPWHMVTLPERLAGKKLYFRIFSNYIDIGLWGDVRVIDRVTLLKNIIRDSSEQLSIAFFSFLIALLAGIFALLSNKECRFFAGVSLFSLCAAGVVVGEAKAMQLLYQAPLFWSAVAAYSYFMVPVAMALLLQGWVQTRSVVLVKATWWLHLLFIAGTVLVTSYSARLGLSHAYPVFDLLFTLSLAVMIFAVLRSFRRVDVDQRVIIGCFGVFSLLLMLDMAVAHGVVTWFDVPVAWGALVFSLAMVALAFRHYLHTQRNLQELNQSLELKVQQRTEQLELLADSERKRSRLLFFANRKAEVLSSIDGALQGCSCMSEALDTLRAELPRLASPFSGKLFYITEGLQVSQVAQWGDYEALSGYEANDKAELDALTAGLSSREGCFFFRYEHLSHGTCTVAVMLLNIFSLPDDEQYDTQGLLEFMATAVDKISITLANINLREELQRFSYEDALTGLKNRRFFDQVMEHEIAGAQRHGGPLSVLMCDIDHFKQFNDTHGHEAGDVVLAMIGQYLRDSFRESDIACRYGGEEFVVIMPGSSASDCMRRARELLQAVQQAPIHYQGESLGYVTISIGVSSWPEQVDQPEQLLRRADDALYLAKERGRNRIDTAAA